MTATLEPIVVVGTTAQAWIARGGPKHERYGDPYDFTCVVIREGDTTARIEALSHGSAVSALLRLRDPLRKLGITDVHWQRVKNVHVHIR